MAVFEGSGTDSADKGGAMSVTLGKAPSSGDVLVAVFSGDNQSDSISIVSAGALKTFTQAQSATYGTDGFCEVWYRECDGTESATITADMATGGTTCWMAALHYSGTGDLSFEAADTGQTGTGTTLTGSNPGSAPNLNVMGGAVEGSNYTFSNPQSGWAIGDDDTGFGNSVVAIHNKTGSAADDGTVDVSTSDDWAAIHVTFTDDGVAADEEVYRLREMGY